MTDKIDISAEAVEQMAQMADAWGEVCIAQKRDALSSDMARIAQTLRALAARLAEVEALSAADFELLDSVWKQRAEAAEAKLEKVPAFLRFLDDNYRHAFGDTARQKIRELHAETAGTTQRRPSPEALILAALEAAANMLEPKNPREDWTDFAKQHHADAIAIRAFADDPESVARIIKAAGEGHE